MNPWAIRRLEPVPVDAHVHEAQHIAHEDGLQRHHHAKVGTVRDFKFQHHDGDDALAEGFGTDFPIAAPLADPSIFVDQPFLVTHLLVEAQIAGTTVTGCLRQSD